jgi:sulfide:quinone oxidoreductase
MTPIPTPTPQTNLAASATSQHYAIVIVGGGAAGLTVAAQLLAKDPKLEVAVIEPSDKHYYQPAWTLVGAGSFRIEKTVRPQKDCIPAGAQWIQDQVVSLDPDHNRLALHSGKQISYDYLVVAAGIQIDWHAIKGLPEALGQGGVCSNYSFQTAPYTWKAIDQFRGGRAIFTHPATPIKCGGAPQKIMYLAEDLWRRRWVRDHSEILFCTALPILFVSPDYAVSLQQVIDRRGITVQYRHNLKEIRPDRREAIFAVTTEAGVEEIAIHYDLLHVAPPMSAPDFIKQSPLAVPNNPGGWVEVDKHTLQHTRYANVFSLGDASSLPTSKTAAAVRRQAPTLVENLRAVMRQGSLQASYGGYTCCPLITSYGTTIMAEFGYDNKPQSSFPFDSRQERYDMWVTKRYILPWLYWNRMIKGKPFEGDLLKG